VHAHTTAPPRPLQNRPPAVLNSQLPRYRERRANRHSHNGRAKQQLLPTRRTSARPRLSPQLGAASRLLLSTPPVAIHLSLRWATGGAPPSMAVVARAGHVGLPLLNHLGRWQLQTESGGIASVAQSGCAGAGAGPAVGPPRECRRIRSYDTNSSSAACGVWTVGRRRVDLRAPTTFPPACGRCDGAGRWGPVQ